MSLQKLRHLSSKNPKKQIVVRQLSSCIHEKFNVFNIISIEYSKKLRKKFKPIDIIYNPLKKPDVEIKCYFLQDISSANRNTWNKSEKLSHGFAYQCYYCGKFFAISDRQELHMEHCSGVPGIIYNFNNQNLVTFEDNLGYKGDLPVVAYINFETTAPIGNCFDPEQKKMFVVSYVIVFAFHPKLKMDRVIIQRSFGHSLEQLTTIDYLTNDQMSLVDIKLIKQLKDSALELSRKKL